MDAVLNPTGPAGSEPRKTMYFVSLTRYRTLPAATPEAACRVVGRMYVPAAPKVIGEIIRERTDDRGNPVVDVNVYARPGETVTVTPREAGWIVSHRMWNNATLYVVFLKYYLFVVAAGKEEAERAVRTEHPGWRVTAIADVVEENPNAAAGQPTYVVRQYSDPSKLTSLIRRLPTTPASAGTPTVSAPPVLDTPTRHV